MNKTSVIIPAYNSANYIADSLESILSQTMLPDEVIVVDDCSKDATQEIVKSWIASSSVKIRLIVLDRNSGGPVAPMNAGVSAATGEYIIMLDHDDRMLPQRIAAALPVIAADPKIGIVFNKFNFFDETRPEFSMYEYRYDHLGTATRTITANDAYRDLILVGYPYGGAGGMLFRKSMWEQIGGFRTQFRIVWDYDFGLRSAANGWDVGYLPEVLYLHRQHESNLESSEGGLRNSREHTDLFLELLGKLSPDKELKNVLLSKIEKHIFRVADAEVLQRNYRNAAYYYGQALRNGLRCYRAARGFVRIPYRYGRTIFGLSNKGE